MKYQPSDPKGNRATVASRHAVKLLLSMLLLFVISAGWSQSASASSLSAPVGAPGSAEVITNTVTINSTTTDPNSLNNTATQTTTVNSEADLLVSKSDGVSSVVPGTTVTYTIIITNAGPSAVSNATVDDTLPAAITSATWACSASSGSNCDDSSGTGDINTTVDLLANGTASFVVVAQVDSTAVGTLVNTVTVTPPTGTTDPNPGNNSATDIDNLLTGTLTGSVFIDTNHDGLQDGGEGLDGVTVVITTSVGTTLSVTTDSNGLFTVTVPAGDTQVDVNDDDLPTGAVQVVGSDPTTVTVPAGGTAQDINGYEQQGTLYGHIYQDTDGNDNQDVGEPNLSGVSVVITDAFGITQTVTTDSSGNYTATVPTGSSSNPLSATVDIVDSTLPAGYVQTEGDDPTVVNSLTAGGLTFEENNGFEILGQVTGVVYMDENGDGDYTPGTDTPLTVDVVITDSNGIAYTVTTVNGYFTQTVPAGSTIVDVVDSTLPAGVILTGGSSDPTTVNVPGGGTAKDDTGYVIYATIGDRVWLDLNGDGIQDANEPGLEGVVVTLTPSSGSPITVTTGSNGNYNFSDLNPGSYTVSVGTTTLPAGVTQTFDRDGTLNDATSATIASATVITDADFGYQGNASIGDLVWNDLNGDGSFDVGEPGFSGVVVTLTFPSGFVITTTTDSNGNYLFDGLIPGTYTVDVDDSTLPAGTVLTTGSNTYSVNLAAAEDYTDADFGYQQQGELFGHIFEDLNGNGVQDSGEPNLSGIDVVVTNGLGVTETLTTDGSGNYTTTVPTGSASNPFTATVDVVESTLPAGAVQTAGTDPNTITVFPATSNNAGIDGYQILGVVEGTVWEDRNNNGVYDAGIDLALNNVTVLITDSNGVTSTVQTNSLGYFSQTVPAGTTTVNVDDGDIASNLLLENGFVDPKTVTVVGNATATTYFPYVEPLTIDEDTSTPVVVAGTQATYTVVLHNQSGVDLTGVVVSDTLPAGFTYASSTIDASGASRITTGDPTVGDNTVLWDGWTISPGGAVTITYVANVASSVDPGTYDTTAEASSDQTGLIDDVGTVAQDSNTPFNKDPEADEDVTIITRADLSVSKTDDRDPVAAGTLLTYTIVVSNAGPSDARDVVITDTLPAGVTFVSASPECDNTVVCSFGTVDVNTTRTVTVVVLVDESLGAIASSGNGPAMVAKPTENEAVASAASLNVEGSQLTGLASKASKTGIDGTIVAAPSTAAVIPAMGKSVNATTLFNVASPAMGQQSTSAGSLARTLTTARAWVQQANSSAMRKNAWFANIIKSVKLPALS